MGPIACQIPPSIGFPRQEYWSGLPCPPLGDYPYPGIKPVSLTSPALAGGSLPLVHLCITYTHNSEQCYLLWRSVYYWFASSPVNLVIYICGEDHPSSDYCRNMTWLVLLNIYLQLFHFFWFSDYNFFSFSLLLCFLFAPSLQFSSVTQSCPTLRDPMNCSTPGLPIHHQLLEFTQTHVHRVRDAIQSSHPLSSPSPPAPNPSQHQSPFQWVNSSHEVAKVLEFQL